MLSVFLDITCGISPSKTINVFHVLWVAVGPTDVQYMNSKLKGLWQIDVPTSMHCRTAQAAVVFGSKMVPAHHQRVIWFLTGCQQLPPLPVTALRKLVRGSTKPTLTHMASLAYTGKCSQTRCCFCAVHAGQKKYIQPPTSMHQKYCTSIVYKQLGSRLLCN